jgi:hypothetical protein
MEIKTYGMGRGHRRLNNLPKIIFLIAISLNKRIYDLLGVDFLLKKGYNVEIWEITPFMYPNIFNESRESGIYKFSGHKIFYSKKDTISALKKIDGNTVIISNVQYNLRSYRIYRTISQKNILYGFYAFNYTSGLLMMKKDNESESDVYSSNLFVERMKGINSEKIKSKMKGIITHGFKIKPGIRLADFFITATEKSMVGYNYPTGPQTKMIFVHSYDYDTYIEEKEKGFEECPKYAVFIDEFIPFHPDWRYQNSKPPTIPGEYYPLLNRFFDYIESKYGFEVKIAAHPASNYDELPDYYAGRKIIKGKTAELIKNSSFVIEHYSGARSFAVLFKKPIIFITTNDMKKSHEFHPQVDYLANWLGKKVLNINENLEIDIESELVVSDISYNEYKHNFIKMNGTEELPFWTIVINSLEKLSKKQ